MAEEREGPEAVQRATEACLRLLRARSRSRQELRLALERKGYAEAVCDEVLGRLQGWGYVDDERFARDRAAALLRGGKLGPKAVEQRLAAHGLESTAVQQAVSSATGTLEFDALATATQVLERRGLLGRPLELKARARAARLLHSRGFSPDVIQRLLGDPSLDPSGLDE
jgi:regulatory protein